MLASVLGAQQVDLEAVGWVHYFEHAGVGELAVESAAAVLGLVILEGLLDLFDGFGLVYQILLDFFGLIDLQRVEEGVVP